MSGNQQSKCAAEMSVSELKREMKNEYGVSDFGDCIEKSDMVAKLDKLRAGPKPHKPRVSRDGFGKVAEIGNKKNPTGIVTLAHGLGDTCDGWTDVAQSLAHSHPHLLFLCPTAAKQKVTLNMGMVMPSWYDVMSLAPGGQEDDAGVMKSAMYIQDLALEAAAKHSIPHSRILFSGFSQGGAVSLAAALTLEGGSPAGALMMSGYLGGRETVLRSVKNTDFPLLMCHGTADPVVALSWAKLSLGVIKGLGGQLADAEFKEYNGMQHTATPKEIRDVADFVSRVLPPM